MKQIIIALFSAVCAYGQSVSTIGNTGQPTTTTGVVPYLIPGITTDQSGKIYTVHDWMESHQDCKTWDPATGQALSNTGNFNTGYLFDAIAVEPDGSVAYVTGWKGNAPTRTLTIWKFDLVHDAEVPFTSAGASIQVSNSATTGLLPIALSGSTLWVADYDGNRVVGYDKTTGALTSSFPVTTPIGIAIDLSRNHLWIATSTAVQVYTTSGKLINAPITNLVNACALCIQGNVLAVADRGAGSIFTYSIDCRRASLTDTFSGFGYLKAIALDPNGNFLVTDSIGPEGGVRMRKFDSCQNLIWTQTCTEFVSNVAYSTANPNTFISLEQQSYTVNRSSMTTTWAGYGGSWIHPTGPIKVLTLGGNDFEFVGVQGAQVVIYRVGSAALTQVGSVTPPQPGPPGTWTANSYSIDDAGTIWMASAYRWFSTPPNFERAAVWKLPLASLDANGNPVYDWTKASEIVTDSQIRTSIGVSQDQSIEVDSEMAVYSPADNLVYVIIYSPTTGVSHGIWWMAGNTLLAFKLDGSLAWKVNLPAPSVGLCPVPTGGVLTGDNTGINNGGIVHRYSNAGTLTTNYVPPASLGSVWPDDPCGSFDCFGAINCELAPDGLLDIFWEDNINCRVGWRHTQ